MSIPTDLGTYGRGIAGTIPPIFVEADRRAAVTIVSVAIIASLKEKHIRPHYTEGLTTGDWIVLDYMQVMIHIFLPSLREKYHLEDLWQKAPIVELAINAHEIEVSTPGGDPRSPQFHGH